MSLSDSSRNVADEPLIPIPDEIVDDYSSFFGGCRDPNNYKFIYNLDQYDSKSVWTKRMVVTDETVPTVEKPVGMKTLDHYFTKKNSLNGSTGETVKDPSVVDKKSKKLSGSPMKATRIEEITKKCSPYKDDVFSQDMFEKNNSNSPYKYSSNVEDREIMQCTQSDQSRFTLCNSSNSVSPNTKNSELSSATSFDSKDETIVRKSGSSSKENKSNDNITQSVMNNKKRKRNSSEASSSLVKKKNRNDKSRSPVELSALNRKHSLSLDKSLTSSDSSGDSDDGDTMKINVLPANKNRNKQEKSSDSSSSDRDLIKRKNNDKKPFSSADYCKSSDSSGSDNVNKSRTPVKLSASMHESSSSDDENYEVSSKLNNNKITRRQSSSSNSVSDRLSNRLSKNSDGIVKNVKNINRNNSLSLDKSLTSSDSSGESDAGDTMKKVLLTNKNTNKQEKSSSSSSSDSDLNKRKINNKKSFSSPDYCKSSDSSGNDNVNKSRTPVKLSALLHESSSSDDSDDVNAEISSKSNKNKITRGQMSSSNSVSDRLSNRLSKNSEGIAKNVKNINRNSSQSVDKSDISSDSSGESDAGDTMKKVLPTNKNTNKQEKSSDSSSSDSDLIKRKNNDKKSSSRPDYCKSSDSTEDDIDDTFGKLKNDKIKPNVSSLSERTNLNKSVNVRVGDSSCDEEDRQISDRSDVGKSKNGREKLKKTDSHSKLSKNLENSRLNKPNKSIPSPSSSDDFSFKKKDVTKILGINNAGDRRLMSAKSAVKNTISNSPVKYNNNNNKKDNFTEDSESDSSSSDEDVNKAHNKSSSSLFNPTASSSFMVNTPDIAQLKNNLLMSCMRTIQSKHNKKKDSSSSSNNSYTGDNTTVLRVNKSNINLSTDNNSKDDKGINKKIKRSSSHSEIPDEETPSKISKIKSNNNLKDIISTDGKKDLLKATDKLNKVNESSFENMLSDMVKVLASDKLAVENSICLEDLNSDDELYHLQCPKNMDIRSIIGKKISLGAESIFKGQSLDGKGLTFESFAAGIPANNILLLPSKIHNKFKLVNLKVKGNLIVSEGVIVPEVDKSNFSSRDSSDEDLPVNRTPLPIGLKIRHPLLGLDYQNPATPNFKAVKSREKKMKKKRMKQDGSTPGEDFKKPTIPSDYLESSLKKKHKSAVNASGIVIGRNLISLDSDDEINLKMRKKNKKEKKHGEEAGQDTCSETEHKKEKKTKKKKKEKH